MHGNWTMTTGGSHESPSATVREFDRDVAAATRRAESRETDLEVDLPHSQRLQRSLELPRKPGAPEADNSRSVHHFPHRSIPANSPGTYLSTA
jgi:hypothetical protein